MTLATLDPKTIEEVVLTGDLSNLTPAQRLEYYNAMCQVTGLNPLTKPFAYLKLDGKLVLYVLKSGTDQLRAVHGISIEIASREMIGDIYIVTARATQGDRVDESTGVVSIAGLRGDQLANAYMKCESKAKRRATLSINGLGLLDESEVESIPGAEPVKGVDMDTGEIQGQAAINPPSRPRPSNRPPRETPKSSVEKMAQLNAARIGPGGAEVYTGDDVATYISANYALRGPRDLTTEEVDQVIQAMLTGSMKSTVGQPAPAE